VISAVGHEPDVTISDYVADLRAATPSNAAELAVPDQEALRQSLDGMSAAMASSLSRQLKAARNHLNVLSQSNCMQSPVSYISHRRELLGTLTNRLSAAQSKHIALRKQRFIGMAAKLDAMSPLKVLARGYAMAQSEDGALLRSVKQASIGENIKINVSDGYFKATVCDVKENLNESKQ